MELEVLQNKIKKDPWANLDFFNKKWKELDNYLKIVKLNPQIYNENFVKLLNFITNTISYYDSSHLNNNNKEDNDKEERDGSSLCLSLTDFLKETKNLNLKMRNSILTCTFILRSKRLIPLNRMIPEWLSVVNLDDRDQRKRLYSFIVRDLILLSKSKHSNNINKIMRVLFERINDKNLNVKLLSVCLLIEMFNKRIINDQFVFNKLASLILNENSKLSLISTYFLLSHKNCYNLTFNNDDTDKDDNTEKDDSEKDNKNYKERKYDRLLDLYEPFELVNGILKKVTKERIKYKEKLTLLKLGAIIIRKHQLSVPQFYSFLGKFVHHKQQNVQQILLIFLLSLHHNLSCEVIREIVDKIISDFISYDRNNTTIIIGLNTMKEVCNVMPDVVNEDTLNYLLEFKNYKSKNINASVKGLINLYRRVNPKLLNKSQRGKEANIKLLNEKRCNINNHEEQEDEDEEDEEEDEDNYSDDSYDSDNEYNNYKDNDNDDDHEYQDDKHDYKDKEEEHKQEEEEDDDDDEMGEEKILFVNEKKMRNYNARMNRESRRNEIKRYKKLAVSNKGKRQSLPNKIKERNKPLLMTLKSKRVKSKLNLSVPQQIKRLKKHVKNIKITKSKKKQRRHL